MPKIDKIVLLVGLMGSGKTSVGKRLAKYLSLPFVDGDVEIEKAAGLSQQENIRRKTYTFSPWRVTMRGRDNALFPCHGAGREPDLWPDRAGRAAGVYG